MGLLETVEHSTYLTILIDFRKNFFKSLKIVESLFPKVPIKN